MIDAHPDRDRILALLLEVRHELSEARASLREFALTRENAGPEKNSASAPVSAVDPSRSTPKGRLSQSDTPAETSETLKNNKPEAQ